jgi:hypothetical protein
LVCCLTLNFPRWFCWWKGAKIEEKLKCEPNPLIINDICVHKIVDNDTLKV